MQIFQANGFLLLGGSILNQSIPNFAPSMDLKSILQRFTEDERTNQIAGKINEKGTDYLHLKGLVGSSAAFAAHAVCKNTTNHAHLFILNDKEQAAYFQNDLQSLVEKKEVLFFPDSFKKPGKFQEPDSNNTLLRTETLNRLAGNPAKNDWIVTYPEALFEKVVSMQTLKKNTLLIRINEKLDIDFITEFLADYGFERTDFVYEPGQFSIRGGIADVFSFGNNLPYRIELFGAEVESIRVFDPVNQLSQQKLSQISVVPDLRTKFDDHTKISFFDFISHDAVVWIKDLSFTRDRIKQCYEFAEDLTGQLKHFGGIEEEENISLNQKPHELFENEKELIDDLQKFFIILFGNSKVSVMPGKREAMVIDYNISPQPSFNKNFNLLIENWGALKKKGFTNFLFSESSRQIERFEHIFEDLKAEVEFFPVPVSIAEGFVAEELKICCYTDHQIFERYHRYRLRQGFSKSKAISLKTLQELKPGDFVTHIDHGVGVYSGLEKLEVNGQVQEAIRLVYRDNDLLYVSINSLYKISKFVGKDGKPPHISKLGSDAWEALKRKTKKKVKDIAKDLIQLYAKRKAQKGFAFTHDTYLQNELEASFIYEDTPDQLKATNDVKKDMEKPIPMDRLICGDVGFGKTEVALRAAFKAVTDGKQVAILVPTTILALQHWKTFSERLKDFPCTIDYLNRFKSSKEQKKTLQKLAEGKIDIIAGTHALAGKNVKFKDLGLLIIDEEQKFGVTVKEKIRQMKATVDTLTLTATPIPRTLQFSLMGARDLSIINTPPLNRQPIETELMMFDTDKLKEIIEFEVYRGGQVFFVHNRVRDIAEITTMIRNLCPNVDVSMAHGQMEGHQLEQTMIDFIERKHEVLVCTNIVESGLDIPNANTIIVNDAQNFGLSDLHQLRGRVGRSNKKAFCYLVTPSFSVLTAEARRRLTTLEEFSELGSGFQIAMRDLDIRGSGDMLGAEQSGFIAEIGYDTYHKILDETIRELKETDFKELFTEQLKTETEFVRDVTIETDDDTFIPDEYVQSPAERLILYKELSELKDEAEIDLFRKKLTDRFGSVPDEVENLFDGLRLQRLSQQLGFEKVFQKKGVLKCFFLENQDSPLYQSEIFNQIIAYIQHHPKRCSLKQTEKKLILTIQSVHSLNAAIEILKQMTEHKGVSV